MTRPVKLANTPPSLLDAILKLTQAVRSRLPHAGCLLVGGFVRDLLLGLSPTDADIEVYGVDVETLERLVQELFPGRVHLVGRAFGVFKIRLDDEYELDVALPRHESKTGHGHKDFAVQGDPLLDPAEAARRRDFTINAIMMDPLTGELVDPWHGQQDLEKRILRVVDVHHFGEDPLRVYRAVQFAARFELTLEAETLATLKAMVAAGELDYLPAERVTEEWRKLLLKAEKPSIGLKLMRELGIIKKYYPELQALIGVEQDAEWHPEGDVWVHTCMCVDAAAKLLHYSTTPLLHSIQVMLGALCHDLGKPSTTALAPKNGVMHIRSLGHEQAGIEPTKTFLRRFTFGEDVERAAVVAANDHLKPGMLWMQQQKGQLTPEQYRNAVRKTIRRIQPVSARVLVAVAEADFRGRTLPESSAPVYEPGAMFMRVVEELEAAGEPLKPLLRGEDLLVLGVSPGPTMGRIIRAVEEARDRGEVKTKEEALALAEKSVSSPLV